MSDSVEVAIQQAAASASATGLTTPIVIKEDRSIVVPTALQQVAVQCDNEANVLHFECPRNWADIDLAAAVLYINVVKPDKSIVAFTCTNIASSENTVTFDWVITGHITEVAGKLSFLVCARDPSDPGDGYRWHSNLCNSLSVAPGIVCTVPSDTPDPPHIPLYGTDTTLTEPGVPADAMAVGDALNRLSEEKVSLPKDASGTVNNGTNGQILQTNGDGSTEWVDKPKGGSALTVTNTASVGQTVKITAVDENGKPTAWEAVDMPISFKPAGKSYLTFSSSSSFTLAVNDATKHWDGTLEYFSSDKTWTVWDGTTTLSAIADDGEYVLYLRGTGNTVITGNNENYRWVLTGTDIKCIGNIENLLDYATVASGAHPTMATYCYRYMFYGCTSLTNAPDLPATKLANYCYSSMFQGCASLAQTPALPATTLVDFCYTNMFYGCAGLTQAPALPATALAINCYQAMFHGCTSLTQAPALPATTLANWCYNSMFYGCTSLTNAPSLPATTLANWCYRSMFQDCTGLTQAPALPATTLASTCYQRMFYGCTSLTQVPALPAMTLTEYCYRGMFQGCTSLKLSSTQTGEYTQEYRIPSSGDGVAAKDALADMFTSTGGTFTGTPAINMTYYLSSDNMIVRETEIDTLNGYVDSMIDVAIAEHTSNPLNITGATVGQIVKIKAVDETGKPTAWEAVDMPSGGGEKAWKYEKYVEFSEETAGFEFTTYDDKTPFDFTEVEISAALKNAATESAWGDVTVISDGLVDAGGKNEKIGGNDSSVSIHTSSGKWYFCYLRGHIDAKNKSIEAMICVDTNILYVNAPFVLKKNLVFQKPNFCYGVNAEQNHWNTPPTKFTTIKSGMTIGAGSSILIRGR